MFHTTTSISVLLLTLLVTLKFGWSWVDKGINEQFYSQLAVDAMGQSIPMTSYTGKVMWQCISCCVYCVYYIAIRRGAK